VLVLAALALGACTDRGAQPRRAVRGDTADQVYSGLSTFITRSGVNVSRVEADSAWMYTAPQIADLKHMKVTFYNDSTGAETATIIADRGIYKMREKSLDARGHVVAVSRGGRVLKTEHLIYDTPLNQVSSDSAWTSTSPQGNFAGKSFVSDVEFKHVTMDRLHGTQKGKGFIIPGPASTGHQ
jgi:LPS export ABC transporter protein LptC